MIRNEHHENERTNMKKLLALCMIALGASTVPALAFDGAEFAVGTLFGFGTGALATAAGSRRHCNHYYPTTTEYHYYPTTTEYYYPARETRYVETDSSYENRQLKKKNRQLKELANQLEAQLSRSERNVTTLELENTHLEAKVARLEREIAALRRRTPRHADFAVNIG